MAVKFQFVEVTVPRFFQVGLHANEQLVKQTERQTVFPDKRSQLAADLELRLAPLARAPDVVPPSLQLFGALGQGHGVIVRDIIHLPAKGVKRDHPSPPGLGKQEKCGCQIGAAFRRNQLAL